jgi:hypothetical protein
MCHLGVGSVWKKNLISLAICRIMCHLGVGFVRKKNLIYLKYFSYQSNFFEYRLLYDN